MNYNEKEKRISLIPEKYARRPLLFLIMLNAFTYWGIRLINEGREHYDLSLAIDGKIPLVTPFIVVYVLAYAHWVLGYIQAANESRRVFFRIFVADLFAKLATMVIFLVFPTTAFRPEATGSGIFDRLTAMIYKADACDNLFPSIHVLESWMVMHVGFYLKKVPAWYQPANIVFTILVCLSTVFLKQHVVVDILGGIVLAEAGYLISGILLKKKEAAIYGHKKQKTMDDRSSDSGGPDCLGGFFSE